MNILYLGYWSVNDGLSQSTVIPNLKILAGFTEVAAILYVSLERGDEPQPLNISKVHHIPFMLSGGIVARGYQELVTLPKWLAALVRQESADLIVCRGAPAGSIGYLVSRQTEVPYVVESFEPHAAYMRESGVWGWWNPKYFLAEWFEGSQKKTASFLLPVTENYKQQLIREGVVPERILVSPCAVDMERLGFSEGDRLRIRQLIGWDEDTTVGVYLGKFGGIYYDDDAFQIFARAKNLIDKFRLLVITPQNKESIYSRLGYYGLNLSECHVCYLAHEEIPGYLSASDFAFSTISPAPSRKFCSPIKNGEYWANGLPIFLTEGVGDDADIIRMEGGGVLFSVSDVKESLSKMKELISRRRKDPDYFSVLAKRYRSFDVIEANYRAIIDDVLKR